MEEAQVPTRKAEEQSKETRTVTTVRRSAGAPQRMQRNRALADIPPPSLEELRARQEAINSTRRPTRPYRADREESDPESTSVPDVPPTSCE